MFIIIWEYIVSEDREAEFLKIYGANGDWMQFFSQGMGYLGTELYRDPNQSRRYITIDRWNSSADFDSFHENYHQEYEGLDERCKSLTEHEARIMTGNLIPST